ncbi:MAG: signal peptidase I [Actinomycetota bacterium]
MAGNDFQRADDPTAGAAPRGDAYESDASARDDQLADTMPLDIDQGGDGAAPVSAPHQVSGQAANQNGPARVSSHRRSRRRRDRSRKSPWWELPVLVVIAVAVAVLIKTFLVQPFYIPSESMERTLHGCAGCSGDRILVNKPIYYLRDVHPGDIVVFNAPSARWSNEPLPGPPSNPVAKGLRWFGQLVGLVPPDEHDLVKRVIATGGQTIKCCDASGKVQVSDAGPDGPFRTLTEPYISDRLSGAEATFGPVTVPKGRLWVMGDNRAHSEDSRWHYQVDYRGDPVGSTVPNGKVIGKAVLIAWPPSRWRTLGTPSSFAAAAAATTPMAGALAIVLPLGLRRRRR